MKHFYLLLLISLFSINITYSQNQTPTISNVEVSDDKSTRELTIQFDLSDVDGDDLEVILKISDNNGESFFYSEGQTQGDVGFPISTGTGKEIKWTYPEGLDITKFKIQLIATDRNKTDIHQMVAQISEDSILHSMVKLAGPRDVAIVPNKLNETKTYIEQRFTEAGLFYSRQPFTVGTANFENVIGRKNGLKDEANSYIIDAHFDSKGPGPGADDNASGVAGFLEALRILKNYHFEKNILFIGFDAEEYGLLGSQKYVQSGIKSWEKIQGVFNYEMIGYYSETPNSQTIPNGFSLLFPNAVAEINADQNKGNFITNVGNDNSATLMNDFDKTAETYVPQLKVINLKTPGNGAIAPDLRRSDHARFWDASIPAVMLTDGSEFRNPHYHEVTDSINTLNLTFMANVTAATLASVATLAIPLQADVRTIDLSNLVSTEQVIAFPYQVKVYPNPVDDILKINLTGNKNCEVTLSIYELSGKLVLQKIESVNTNQELEISTSKIQVGQYQMVLEVGDDKYSTVLQIMNY